MVLIISVFCLNSCSIFESLSKAKADPNYIPETGDPVEITAADSRTYKLFIREITADSLKSDKYNFALAEIQEIKRLKNSPWPLLGVMAGGILIGVLALIVIGIASGSTGNFSIGG